MIVPSQSNVPKQDLRPYGERGILQVVRQSSLAQFEHNRGGRSYQQSEMRYLEVFNIQHCPLTLLELCESAHEDSEREGLEQIVEFIRNGIGMIIFSYGSRIARDEEHGARLIKAARRHHVIFLVSGQVLDPRNRHHHATLMRMIVDARLDGEERTWVFGSAKYAKGMLHELVQRLPTGLMWADPQHTPYVLMMEHARLQGWLEESELKKYQVRSPQPNGSVLYPLPNPYPGVFRACQMVAQWMLETRDPTEVLWRIRNDPSYPRPGKFPRQETYLFTKSRELDWRSASTMCVKDWFRSPAIYGIYQCKSPYLFELGEIPAAEYVLEDGFPSFLRAIDRQLVRDAYADPRRKFVTGHYRGPRNHMIPSLRCGELRDAGEFCGCKMAACYHEDGSFRYGSRMCFLHGHRSTCPSSLDVVVLETVLDVFQTAAVEEAVNQLRRSAEDSAKQRADLSKEVDALERAIEFAMDQQTAAGLCEDDEAETRWKERGHRLMHEASLKRADLKRLSADRERIRELSRSEYDQIKRLASDVPELLQQARQLDLQAEEQWRSGDGSDSNGGGYVRKVIGRLVGGVYVKDRGLGVSEVEVVFRTGERVTRLHLPEQRPNCSHAERVWITYRLSQGMSAPEVAVELNEGWGKRRRDAWTSAMIGKAALYHESAEWERGPEGACVKISMLAEQLGESENIVFRAALRGKLGTARLVDGELAFQPTDEQLERVFACYARRATAERQQWPLADTLRATELARETGLTSGCIADRGERCSGVAYDLAGRRYVRRSETANENHLLDLALRNAPAELRTLDPKYWTSLSEVRKRHPGIAFNYLLRITKSVMFGRRHRYFYVDNVVEAVIQARRRYGQGNVDASPP